MSANDHIEDALADIVQMQKKLAKQIQDVTSMINGKHKTPPTRKTMTVAELKTQLRNNGVSFKSTDNKTTLHNLFLHKKEEALPEHITHAWREILSKIRPHSLSKITAPVIKSLVCWNIEHKFDIFHDEDRKMHQEELSRYINPTSNEFGETPATYVYKFIKLATVMANLIPQESTNHKKPISHTLTMVQVVKMSLKDFGANNHSTMDKTTKQKLSKQIKMDYASLVAYVDTLSAKQVNDLSVEKLAAYCVGAIACISPEILTKLRYG